MRLTEQQKDRFWENGFVAIEDAIAPERVEAMCARFEELCEAWDTEEAQRVGVQQEAQFADAMTDAKTAMTVRKFYDLVPHEPVFRAHVQAPGLLDMAEDLIGTPFSLYADQAFMKPPEVGSAKVPHQDNAHFLIEPDDAVITCWCALDDATLENGCLHYIVGSHKRGLLDHRKLPESPHLIPEGIDLSEGVPVPIRAGGIIFHHALALHFSHANTTPHWRRAFACHLVRSDAKVPNKKPEQLLRLR
jgi:ectoine hydroxylase-related dioxygenase (phytanoyl-CoA dioxygenase family)